MTWVARVCEQPHPSNLSFGVLVLWKWVENGTIVTLDWVWSVQESHTTLNEIEFKFGRSLV